MIEHLSRRLFFICLYPCTLLVLFIIWNGGPDESSLPPALFQTAASLFVVGLAAFLTWFVVSMSRALQSR